MLENILVFVLICGVLGAAADFYARLIRRAMARFRIRIERHDPNSAPTQPGQRAVHPAHDPLSAAGE